LGEHQRRSTISNRRCPYGGDSKMGGSKR
jgi:hypothetical protein